MSSKPVVQCLQDDINELIDKYRDSGITLSETIGCIELIKHDIINNTTEDEGDQIY